MDIRSVITGTNFLLGLLRLIYHVTLSFHKGLKEALSNANVHFST